MTTTSQRFDSFPPGEAPAGLRIAVVIPCYRVADRIEGVLRQIGPEVWRIYCIDDGCPELSGQAAERAAVQDPRIRVLRHPENRGVGAAVVTGYRQALRDRADVIVKIDGDGQMDPRLIPQMVAPILRQEADYVKGNRFFHLESLRSMSWIRLIGNAGLSFWAKLSSGYWNSFDPTNGFTAVHAAVARQLPLDKLSRRFFFESDVLFRLNLVGALVDNVPMDARYAGERSNLVPWKSLVVFPLLHSRNLAKRIFYNYFLRDFSIPSLHLLVGILLTACGAVFGTVQWIKSVQTGVLASAGTVMLSALLVILGLQFLLSFISYDIARVPKKPIHPKLYEDDLEERLVSRTVRAAAGLEAGRPEDSAYELRHFRISRAPEEIPPCTRYCHSPSYE
ncbi:MAG: glycosyltransferase family 2 protein [Pirellulales bacterium]|nr:glycosyltransferase family 2 protein [Pirellulales bacterium]